MTAPSATANIPCCQFCFYSRMVNAIRYCCCNAPAAMTTQTGAQLNAIWPTVADNQWCGQGWDRANGAYGPKTT